jgi:hypothetical protein
MSSTLYPSMGVKLESQSRSDRSRPSLLPRKGSDRRDDHDPRSLNAACATFPPARQELSLVARHAGNVNS